MVSDIPTSEYVIWAYRLLLGREPETLDVVDNNPFVDRSALVRHFVQSPEFAVNNGIGPSARIGVGVHAGYSIYAALDDQLIGSPVYHGVYEPNVTDVFRRYLRRGMNVLDIGANIGHFTMVAASIVGPGGIVTAVEANPDNAKLLEASRLLNNFDFVRLICAAAARDTGLMVLEMTGLNARANPIQTSEQLWLMRVTPSLPLRAVLPGDRPLDFVKMDIEGAEYNAVLGFIEILKRDRPVIVSEFAPSGLEQVSQVDGEVYLRLLRSLDLELAVIELSGGVTWFGSDIAGVMAAFDASGSDHIDIIAAPPEQRDRLVG